MIHEYYSLPMLASLFAYIDPGSGSYFYQIAIASLTTVVFFFSTIKRRIAGFFKRKEEPLPVTHPVKHEMNAESEKSTLAG